MLVGYARVSSVGQSLDIQLEQLRAAGCGRIFSEKRSGRNAADRPQLQEAIAFCREGDTLIVARVDRLARSMVDLHTVVTGLAGKGVGFRCLQQGAIDTTTSDGKLFLNILGSFAEFEADIRRERQMDGIAAAKERGVYAGRPATIDPAKVRDLKAQGVRPADIARQLGIGRASVYRALETVA